MTYADRYEAHEAFAWDIRDAKVEIEIRKSRIENAKVEMKALKIYIRNLKVEQRRAVKATPIIYFTPERSK